jgi:uncharacterized membrane protein
MLKKFIEVSTEATVLRTLVFTLGHFLIDVFVIAWVTQSPVEVATIAAVVGPAINGVWFFIIDRVWSSLHAADESQHNFGFRGEQDARRIFNR